MPFAFPSYFKIQNATQTIAWINSTGSFNFTGDLICSACINPEDINDVDKEDIETDLNTFAAKL